MFSQTIDSIDIILRIKHRIEYNENICVCFMLCMTLNNNAKTKLKAHSFEKKCSNQISRNIECSHKR